MTDQTIRELPINQIAIDHRIQLKARGIDNNTVTSYVEAINNGAEFAPIVIFQDGETYRLADGFHRISAYRFLGHTSVKAKVQQGTYNDAMIYAATANTMHGRPMSQAEKREAGERLLALTNWAQERIAKELAVGVATVSRWKTVSLPFGRDTITVTRNGSIYTMDTLNIGKRSDPDPVLIDSSQPLLINGYIDKVIEDCDHHYLLTNRTGLAPYYQNQQATVYNCDFRTVLPSINDGFFIFDPPYNIGFEYDIYPDNLPDEVYIEMLSKFRRFSKVVVIQYPEEMQRLVVPALGVPDHCSAWCYNSNTSRRFRLINWYGLTPDYSRIKQPYKNPTDRRVAELIANGNVGTDLYEWWTDIQIVKNVSPEKTSHPCPIPEALIKRIITLGADPGDVIIDPFAGSLTTLKAAQDLGYRAIGMEISESYIKDGLYRLSQFNFSTAASG